MPDYVYTPLPGLIRVYPSCSLRIRMLPHTTNLCGCCSVVLRRFDSSAVDVFQSFGGGVPRVVLLNVPPACGADGSGALRVIYQSENGVGILMWLFRQQQVAPFHGVQGA